MKLYFDIGANIGEYAKFLFSNRCADKVICVEPNNYIAKILKNNLSTHRDGVVVINKAVSCKKKAINFYICQSDNRMSTCDLDWVNKSRFTDMGMKWEKTIVSTISIDDMISLYGKPTEIKIDVEGYELNAIKSMGQFYNCHLSFEWAEEKLNETISAVKYLNKLGYNKFSIQQTDKYDYVPNEYQNSYGFIKLLSYMCNIHRKQLWGMIHCQKETIGLIDSSSRTKDYIIPNTTIKNTIIKPLIRPCSFLRDRLSRPHKAF